MKITITENYYPYMKNGGDITMMSYHTTDSYAGICLTERESPVKVKVTADFDLPDNPSEAVVAAFDREIEKERAKSQFKIETLQHERQKFLALDVES